MFDATSRYFKLPVNSLLTLESDGTPREIRYVQRRFIPSTAGLTTLVEHQVAQGERLDTITAKYVSDPTQFWRIADANTVLDPNDLTATVGQTITIALPRIS